MLRGGVRIGTVGHTPHCGFSRNSALAGPGVAAKLLSAFAQRYSADSRRLFGIPARARQRIEISLRPRLLRKTGVLTCTDRPLACHDQRTGWEPVFLDSRNGYLPLLTALRSDVEVERFAEAVGRCIRDVLQRCRPSASSRLSTSSPANSD